MSKKNKVKLAESTPDIYKSIPADPKLAKLCLVEDHDGNRFLFPNRQKMHMVLTGLRKCWDTFTPFHDEGQATILAYHSDIFKSEPPKGQDITATALWVWYAMCQTAAKRLEDASATKDPTTGRKSTILLCKYLPGEEYSAASNPINTPQALACMKIFRDLIDALPEPKLGETRNITEGDLKAAVIARAGELKTRQDPWRIFQYYRPQLIAAKLMKRI